MNIESTIQIIESHNTNDVLATNHAKRSEIYETIKKMQNVIHWLTPNHVAKSFLFLVSSHDDDEIERWSKWTIEEQKYEEKQLFEFSPHCEICNNKNKTSHTTWRFWERKMIAKNVIDCNITPWFF